MTKKWWQAAAMATVLGVTTLLATPAEASFSDVKTSNSHKVAIDALTKAGVLRGFEDGTFRPSVTITRGQVAKVLSGVLTLNTQNVENPNFSDIPMGHAYYREIAALANAGIISGFTDGTYRPGGGLTREQMARMLVNAYGLTYNFSDLPFSDVVKNSEAHMLVGALYEYGITTGRTPTIFDLASSVTRGQLATFVYRTTQLMDDLVTLELSPDAFYVDALDAYTYELEEPVISLRQAGHRIIVEALRPGKTLLFLDGYHETDEYYEYAFSQKYAVTVGERNGQLTIEMEEDDSLTPGSTIFSADEIGFAPKQVTLQTLSGELIDTSMYALQYHVEEQVYELMLFEAGEYIATFTDGSGKSQRAGIISEMGETELYVYDALERNTARVTFSDLGFKPVKVEYEQFTGMLFKEPVVTGSIETDAFIIRHAMVGDAMFSYKLTGASGDVMYIQGASYQTAGITTIEYTVVTPEEMASGIF